MDYCLMEFTRFQKAEIFHMYTADLLKAIAESVGATVNSRYSDLTDFETKDERTGDEVAYEVITKLGLKVKQ